MNTEIEHWSARPSASSQANLPCLYLADAAQHFVNSIHGCLQVGAQRSSACLCLQQQGLVVGGLQKQEGYQPNWLVPLTCVMQFRMKGRGPCCLMKVNM